MNITLWTAADSTIGIGHLRRTEALADALRAQGVTLRVLFQGEARLARLLESDSQCVQRVANVEQALQACAAAPGLVVSDLPGLGEEQSQRLREAGCGPLVHLTDADGLRYAADVFLDGDALDKPHIGQRMGGAKYNILRAAVLAHRPARAWTARKVRRVLVCLGGADPGHCTEHLLVGWRSPARLTLVAGPAVPLSRQRVWRRYLRRSDRLVYAPDDLPSLLLKHDLIVTLGGITSYEAMSLGRPVAAVAWKHMLPYVRGLAAAGLIHDLGPAEYAGTRLQCLVRRPTTLARGAALAFRCVDGHGAQRCADVIIGLSSGFR